MIRNHIGYGLRNDEKPFAHKIPPGGNWRNLTHDEQLIYWNGKIPTEGGVRMDFDAKRGMNLLAHSVQLHCRSCRANYIPVKRIGRMMV